MKKINELFITIKTFIQFYLVTVRKLSKNTVESYKKTLDLYIRFISLYKNKDYFSVDKSDFTRDNIVLFMNWLAESRNNAPPTVNLRLSNIKVFCAYLMKDNLLDQAELYAINEIKDVTDERVKEFIWLSLEQTKILLSLPDETDRLGIRDKFFIALLYDSGCRLDEILSLKCGDFKIFNDGYAEIHVVGKGRKFRITALSDKIIPIYNKYMTRFHRSELTSDINMYLFYTNYKRSFNKMSEDNGQKILKNYDIPAQTCDPQMPHLHPHLLRRTRAMHLYFAGVPLYMVSEWLGHSQIETTQVYAQATVEMKRKALKKLEDKEESVFEKDQKFKYEDDEEVLKQLYGLK